MVTNLTKENFASEVTAEKKTVLIDFWAGWCGPCRMIAPTIDEIAMEHPELKVCKVNVDDEPELAQMFQVMSIPMLAVLKGGQLVESTVGVRPKADILRMAGIKG